MNEPEPHLQGLRVAAFESRRATELERLIERFGGQAFVSPSLREVALEDNAQAVDFVHRLLVGEVSVVIFSTGVGFQHLLTLAQRKVDRQRYLDSLSDIVTIARGPKPSFAMRDVGLTATHTVQAPNTWREVLTTIDQQVRVDNAVVAVQEYGESNTSLIAGLEARGAEVLAVPVYRWDLPEDLEPLRRERAPPGGCGSWMSSCSRPRSR